LFARFLDDAAAGPWSLKRGHPLCVPGVFRTKAKSNVGASRLLLEWCRATPLASMPLTVDTHVKPLSGRLGLSRQTDLRRLKPDLMHLVPQPEWENLSIRQSFLGRALCTGRRPACDDCPIADLCPSQIKG
jgi:endonuclease-3